jgi:hypothetical protein
MYIPGPKLTQVFASRWKALLWAAGILVSAYFFVPRQGEDSDKDDAQAIAMAKQVMPGGAASSQADSSQLSPWAAASSAAH